MPNQRDKNKKLVGFFADLRKACAALGIKMPRVPAFKPQA